MVHKMKNPDRWFVSLLVKGEGMPEAVGKYYVLGRDSDVEDLNQAIARDSEFFGKSVEVLEVIPPAQVDRIEKTLVKFAKSRVK